jgi:hypothetical protein
VGGDILNVLPSKINAYIITAYNGNGKAIQKAYIMPDFMGPIALTEHIFNIGIGQGGLVHWYLANPNSGVISKVTMTYVGTDPTSHCGFDNFFCSDTYNSGGVYSAKTLASVPEPSTLAMSSIGALFLARRRK